MPFSQADRADTNKPRFFRDRTPWPEGGSIDAVRIQKAFGFRYAIIEHRVANEFRRAEDDVSSLQFTIASGKKPARNSNSSARAPEITLPLPKAVKTSGMTAGSVHDLEGAGPFGEFK